MQKIRTGTDRKAPRSTNNIADGHGFCIHLYSSIMVENNNEQNKKRKKTTTTKKA